MAKACDHCGIIERDGVKVHYAALRTGTANFAGFVSVDYYAKADLCDNCFGRVCDAFNNVVASGEEGDNDA
jgi:hypothetical protein